MKMQHKLRSLVVLLFLFPTVAVCQTGKLSVSGIVRDEQNNSPLSGISVRLLGSTQQDATPAARTDPEGRYQFVGLPAGSYTVVVEVGGYVPVRQPVEELNGRSGESGELHLNIYARRAATARGVSSATASVDVHELRVPEKAVVAFNKGINLLAKSDLSGSIAQFQRAIKEYPDYYEAYAELGIAYARETEVQPAEAALRKSVELSGGKYAEAFFLLAELLNKTSHFADAESFARQGLALKEESWLGNRELGQALYGQRRLSDALVSAVRARNLNSGDPVVYLVLTNIHVRLRDYPAALEDLNAYLALQPTGDSAEQARTTRAQVERALQVTQADARTSRALP
jgi:tetratricopeptide (TPR) repeat protein